jgi:hypothetical protein
VQMPRRVQLCSKLRERCPITCLLFVVPLVYFLYSLIVVQPHDGDLDSFLYLGSRLAAGNLIYFTDFETKLPLLQYVFWIPYHLGGIGAWRLLIFALSSLLGLLSSHFIVCSLTQNSADLNSLSRIITPLSASLFLSFLYSLPGSSSAQIEIFAAVFIYLAISLWHRAIVIKTHATAYLLLSGFATAIAISIRPNYLFAMPAFVLFGIVSAAGSAAVEKYSLVIKQVTLFILAASLTTLIQFIPYFANDNGQSVLFSAMSAMLHFWSGSSFIHTLAEQFFSRRTVAFYLFMYIGMGTMLIIVIIRNGLRPSNLTDTVLLSGTLLCLVSIVGITYSSARTHYNDHYSILYVPYASVIFTYLCIVLCQRTYLSTGSGALLVLKYRALLALLFVWYFFVVGVQLLSLIETVVVKPEFSLYINDRDIDAALLDFLKRAVSRRMSFYVPGNLNYHRLLKQDRIGDGHPAMLREVLSGRRVGPVGSIFLYSDTVYKVPCVALWESQKDIIVIVPENASTGETNQQVLRCLLQPSSGYKEVPFGQGEYRTFTRRQSLDRIPEDWIH